MTQIIGLRPGQSWPAAAPLPRAELRALVTISGRAPSLFNTQPWAPQILLQFGRVHTSAATPRRPAADLLGAD